MKKEKQKKKQEEEEDEGDDLSHRPGVARPPIANMSVSQDI